MTDHTRDLLATDDTPAGFNTVLMGPAGTGKTTSIATLVEAGIEVFYIQLEPGLESLLGYWKDRNLEVPPNLHWHTVKAAKASFLELIDSAKKVNTLTLDSLTKVSDPHRSKHNQFIYFLEAMNNFKSDRTGEEFGSVATWGPGRALVIDGLTGINRAAMSLTVGGKPVRSQADWQIAQTQIENVLRQLTDATLCHFVLIAHVEREKDEIMGGIKIMPSTLGKALAPKIPAMFSDVILCARNGTKWTWDTASGMADVKARNLPIKADNEQDFKAILKTWQKRFETGKVE